MLYSSRSLQRHASLAIIPFVFSFAAGCGTDTDDRSDGLGGDTSAVGGGDSSGGAASGGAASGGAASGDGGSDSAGGANNLPNPAGLGPAPVELGSTTDLAAPASYVLLAKTGITNVTGSLITGGHLGVSPEVAESITGFALTADSTNVFSTSPSVASPGKIYASNYASPTPSNLTTAVLGMQAAYTDAAGRADPDFLNLASGNIGGETLEPGLYTWGTAVTIPDDVTIAGGADDVWIFQISDDLGLSSATNVILSGGAQAKNIFWQVAGDVTIQADAHFEGIILSQTGITLQTGATMNGRALAQSLIAIDDNVIVAP